MLKILILTASVASRLYYVENRGKNHFRATPPNIRYLVSFDVFTPQIVNFVKIKRGLPPADFHINVSQRSSAQKTPKNGQKCHFSTFDQYFGPKFFMKTASNQKSSKVCTPRCVPFISKKSTKIYFKYSIRELRSKNWNFYFFRSQFWPIFDQNFQNFCV